jgi:acyl dehydratase
MPAADACLPVTTYLEDISVGDRRDLGTVTADREEMIAFARRYDPQPFHTDEGAAATSHFDGIVASGWYTASLCMRPLVEEVLTDAAALGALGLEELRWPAPVRPGDVLSVTNEVVDKRDSETNPRRGVVTARLGAERADGTEVLTWTASVLWARRGER